MRGHPTLPGLAAAADDRFQTLPEEEGVPAFLINIPETIPAMGYGSHQFFRYYGKFPALLGAEIIRRWAKPHFAVLDCYAGSGTTLVEAQIRGLSSRGIDINPLAVLAANVKTSYFDYSELRSQYERLLSAVPQQWPGAPEGASRGKVRKWFKPEVEDELSQLRRGLLELDPGPARRFLLVAFLAIIRRTSNAYDGEVRPHVNPAKKPRPPIRAFADKFEGMLKGLKELDDMRPQGIPSKTVLGDNRSGRSYAASGSGPAQLVVAHPPYLNSFNYLQVYMPEFMWAEGFEEVWNGWTLADIRALEHKAWPATDEQLRRQYYVDLEQAAQSAFAWLSPGGIFALVVGDATIRGRHEPVIRNARRVLETIGYTPKEVWFRTTHYGIGKYAYRDRADYHGEAVKRDAVLFLERPR